MEDAYYRLRRYSTSSFHISPHGTSVAGDIETDVTPVPEHLVRVQGTGGGYGRPHRDPGQGVGRGQWRTARLASGLL